MQGEWRSRQRELYARRVCLENKHKLREETAAEFGILHLQSLRRTQRLLKQKKEHAIKRNAELLQEVERKQDSIVNLNCTDAVRQLKEARDVFSLKVERVYPAWHEELQRKKLGELKALEKTRDAIYQRRLLAKQTFDQEKALNTLIQQTRQDLEMSSVLERNEAFERQLARSRAEKQAIETDAVIQDQAIRAQEDIVTQHKVFATQESFGPPVHDIIDTLETKPEVVKESSPKRTRSSIHIDAIVEEQVPEEETALDELSPTIQTLKASTAVPELESATINLTMSDRSKVLSVLLSKIEQGSDSPYATSDEIPSETKRELIKMALTGRTAQLSFFGSDACTDLVQDLITDIALDLFPEKAFEGKMNAEKLEKIHRSKRGGPGDIWLCFIKHLQNLVQDKRLTLDQVVDHFSNLLLDETIANDRSRRKIRDFLRSVMTPDVLKQQSSTGPSISKQLFSRTSFDEFEDEVDSIEATTTATVVVVDDENDLEDEFDF